ncbi:MAG: hypothetical protein M1827_001400 [Pycnora praestabilis]|nr:MAG: hypothetical protein M1827_001400 [Pycnora praestabilis]
MRLFYENVDSSTLSNVFTFAAVSKPTIKLSFSRPYSPLSACCGRCQRHLKRSRPLADVDGEGSEQVRKKKRRLRLDLVTSRLSRPYSSPPTHIIDRGLSKIAVWAKQKALGRHLLRKAAIMNRIKQAAAAREIEQKQMEIARQAFRSSSCFAQVPRRIYVPLPPSPLGLSNYDALDLEDGLHNDDDGDDEEAGDAAVAQALYSDFNILDSSEPIMDEYDSLDKIDGVPKDERPPSPPDEKIVEMMREAQRQKEISFVDLGAG